MNRETHEKQRAFAGELKPSMKRRAVDHDYHGSPAAALALPAPQQPHHHHPRRLRRAERAGVGYQRRTVKKQ